jgi:hypothetical protein
VTESDSRTKVLLKEYELAAQALVASRSRFFQVEALVITLVWGGFALFVTQTSAGSTEHVLVVSAAAASAIGFSSYWVITANRFRYEEMIIINRLQEIEAGLGLRLHTDASIDIRRQVPPGMPDEERKRYQQLKTKIKLPWPVRASGRVATSFPLGMFIGVGGIVIWLVLVARAFAARFGAL